MRERLLTVGIWILRVVGIVAAAAVAVAVLTTLSDAVGPSLLPAVQAVAALALILVTLVYTGATQRLAKNENYQAQGVALDQLREGSMTLGIASSRASVALENLVKPDVAQAARVFALERIEELREAADVYIDRIFFLHPSLPREVRGLASEASDLANDLRARLRTLSDLVEVEIKVAESENRDFLLPNVIAAWEGRPQEDGLPRWSSIATLDDDLMKAVGVAADAGAALRAKRLAGK